MMLSSPNRFAMNEYTSFAHSSMSLQQTIEELSAPFVKSTVWLPKASSCIRSRLPPKINWATVRLFITALGRAFGSLIPLAAKFSAIFSAIVFEVSIG